MILSSRLALPADIPRLRLIMDAAIGELQRGYLDESQIASSRAIMGIDTQLIDDGTYFAIESASAGIVGCGGWSRRATLYGNNSTRGRNSRLLDPAVDAARVRAMYTDPAYTTYGFRPLEHGEDATGGAPVPLIKMEKPIDPTIARG